MNVCCPPCHLCKLTYEPPRFEVSEPTMIRAR
jgi:hypothetical protein